MMCGSRWKIALTLAGIFLAGGVAGGFAGYVWAQKDPRPRMSPDQYTERYLQRMIGEVKLTSEQVECLRPMMEEFSEKLSVMRQKAFAEVRVVLKDMDRRIEADLTPEQRTLYRDMQARDRKLWEKRFSGPPKGSEGAASDHDAPGEPMPKPLPPPAAPSSAADAD